jgi:site-specific DNA-methyltransferase (adenine-specific)
MTGNSLPQLNARVQSLAAPGSPNFGLEPSVATERAPVRSGVGGLLDTVQIADCIEFMEALPDACVDAVITDLPYGTTSNRWDTVIDLPAWWLQVRRLCRGAVVTTASQPFTAQMVMSNVEEFRHEWVWRKNRGSNFANTVREPFKEHESVVVFAAGKWTYNAQRETRRGAGADRANYKCTFRGASENYRKFEVRKDNELTVDRVPSSVQDWNTETGLHPTQKPIEMMRYLVRTYTNPGDVVLDMCCGSGSTLLAAKQEGRHYLGCDREAKYVEIARGRLASEFFLGGGGAEPAGDDAATKHSGANSGNGEVSDTAQSGASNTSR